MKLRSYPDTGETKPRQNNMYKSPAPTVKKLIVDSKATRPENVAKNTPRTMVINL